MVKAHQKEERLDRLSAAGTATASLVGTEDGPTEAAVVIELMAAGLGILHADVSRGDGWATFIAAAKTFGTAAASYAEEELLASGAGG